MQYLKMVKDMTLSQLSNIVGSRNVDSVLNTNNLERSVNMWKAFTDRNKEILDSYEPDATVPPQKKVSILNLFAGDSDIFEKVALGSEDDWKLLAQSNRLTDAMKIPEEITLPASEGILGNGIPITDRVYQECVSDLLSSDTGEIDPKRFTEYNASFSGNPYGYTSTAMSSAGELFQQFKLPFGEVCLYSSLSEELLYFPVYPEELSDGYSANYDEMGEMLYQYEPWKVYKSSGPREISFNFEFHRDMWTGDHRDGMANHLIRSCEANCFPEYNGALVHAPTVSLYIHGKNFITGVMTECKVDWDGPIGLDGFYLKCKLSFTITEISPEPLNFTTVKYKGLIS